MEYFRLFDPSCKETTLALEYGTESSKCAIASKSYSITKELERKEYYIEKERERERVITVLYGAISLRREVTDCRW